MDFSFLPNYYTIGSLISTLFFSFMVYIFSRIKNPSHASRHLFWMVLFMAIFNLSYFVTHGFSGVPNLWTRWTNIVAALFGASHASLFYFYYPNPRNESLAKKFHIGFYTISLLVSVFVLIQFWNAPFYYIFNSHFWDSDTLPTQQVAGLIIFGFFMSSFILGTWRSIKETGQHRKILIIFTISMAIVMMLPGVFHVLSRDGLMERSSYMSSTVIFNLVGFFFIVITFINNTTDKTTILVRLIGVSVVTLLLILQIASYFWLKNVEDSFDKVHISLAKESFVEGIHHPAENYRLVYDLASDRLEREEGNIDSIDLTVRVQYLRNTGYYNKSINLNDGEFLNNFREILSDTHPNFIGYKGWLQTALDKGEISNAEDFKNWISNHTNRIRYLNSKFRAIKESDWDEKKAGFMENVSKSLPGFMDSLEKSLNQEDFSNISKKNFELYIVPILQQETRNFSGSIETDGTNIPQHSIVYTSVIHLGGSKKIIETGFNYKYYRENIAESSWTLIIIIVCSYLFILLGFKFFFGGALLVPIQTLVDGLTEVNNGNLDVSLKIKVEDEIGFMTRSFNNMTWSIKSSQAKLQEYAEQLEQKVEERTRELSDTLKKVQDLKTQQDGDYFLTTLLLEPLGHSEIQSNYFSLESYVKQKKQFTFRKWSNNIGGDINIAQQVILNGKSHIVFVNADAMGKSMQGAGGALVMGSVFHTILDRTEMTPSMQMMYPERWLKNLFVELHKVFESFNGSMLMSGFFGVLDEESGFLYYLNCEHPQGVLYRDGKASFFEKDVVLRKLGTSSVEGTLKIETFQMEPGDVIYLGSDGRDDILTDIDEEGARVINEDETLFLNVVEKAGAEMNRVVDGLNELGEMTDDLSLMRIERFVTPHEHDPSKKDGILQTIQKANQFIEEEKFEDAIDTLNQYSENNPVSPEIVKALARLYYQVQNYELAAKHAQDYLFLKPSDHEFLYFASLCFRRIKDYHKSIDISERLRLRNFNFAKNLGLLADLHLKMGNKNRALAVYHELEEIDPTSHVTQYLREKLENMDIAGK